MTDEINWRSRCRRPALGLALASVVLPLASFAFALLPISWETYTPWSGAIAVLLPVGVLCGLSAIPFGLMGRSRLAVITGILVGGGPILFLLQPSGFIDRQASPESAAVANVRTINTAEVTYFETTKGTYGDIPQLISFGLLDSRFTSSVSGYKFDIQSSAAGYTATAMPASTNAGRFGYLSFPDAVVRYTTLTTPTCKPCFPKGESGQPVQ